MFISSMWDVKEPTHYSKSVGHEVPGVVDVLCECMGGYRDGDIPRMGLLCKSCRKKRSRGPNTEPYGSPQGVVALADTVVSTSVVCTRPLKYEEN